MHATIDFADLEIQVEIIREFLKHNLTFHHIGGRIVVTFRTDQNDLVLSIFKKYPLSERQIWRIM